MPYSVYLSAPGGALLPYAVVVDDEGPPPPTEFEVYLDDIALDLDKFGVTGGGQPYYDTVAVTGGDEATFGVDGLTDQPYLED